MTTQKVKQPTFFFSSMKNLSRSPFKIPNSLSSLTMSDVGLQVLDGSQLSNADFSLPDGGAVAGARVLEIGKSRASDCLYGLKLPKESKKALLERLMFDTEKLQAQQEKLGREGVESLIRDTDEDLRDTTVVVLILDGNTIRLFLEDEDEFAMLAENLFTYMDAEDKGKLRKSDILGALVHMGVDMGVPPLSDFPVMNDILKKHGAEGGEKLGQAQFAHLLQQVLQDVADTLALKPLNYILDVEITNGSKLRKLLADGTRLDDVIEKIYQQKHNHQKGQGYAEVIRAYLEKNGKELGLPPAEANEAVILLYDAIFSDVDKERAAKELPKEELREVVKQILQKFAEQLEANPVFNGTTS